METQLPLYDVPTPSRQQFSDRSEVEKEAHHTNSVVLLVVVGSLYSLLAIGLVMLRVVERIDWSWITLTAPLWAPLLMTLAIIGIFTVATHVMNTFSHTR